MIVRVQTHRTKSSVWVKGNQIRLQTIMAGPMRPQIVLFGSSIIQMSFDNGGWGGILGILANLYARKVFFLLL